MYDHCQGHFITSYIAYPEAFLYVRTGWTKFVTRQTDPPIFRALHVLKQHRVKAKTMQEAVAYTSHPLNAYHLIKRWSNLDLVMRNSANYEGRPYLFNKVQDGIIIFCHAMLTGWVVTFEAGSHYSWLMWKDKFVRRTLVAFMGHTCKQRITR